MSLSSVIDGKFDNGTCSREESDRRNVVVQGVASGTDWMCLQPSTQSTSTTNWFTRNLQRRSLIVQSPLRTQPRLCSRETVIRGGKRKGREKILHSLRVRRPAPRQACCCTCNMNGQPAGRPGVNFLTARARWRRPGR